MPSSDFSFDNAWEHYHHQVVITAGVVGRSVKTLLLEIGGMVLEIQYRFNFDGLLFTWRNNRVVLVSKPKIGDDFMIWVSFRYVGEFDVNK